MKPAGIYLWLACAILAYPTGTNAQTCRSSIPASTPTSAFVLVGDGTVLDTRTGLMWSRCSEGQSWNGTACTGTAASYTWQQALQRAVAINAGGGHAGHSDWRVPNAKELHSLVEEQCGSPAINTSVFPATPASSFWSASPNPRIISGFSFVWCVDFDDGSSVDLCTKDFPRHMRLVRSDPGIVEVRLHAISDTNGEQDTDHPGMLITSVANGETVRITLKARNRGTSTLHANWVLNLDISGEHNPPFLYDSDPEVNNSNDKSIPNDGEWHYYSFDWDTTSTYPPSSITVPPGWYDLVGAIRAADDWEKVYDTDGNGPDEQRFQWRTGVFEISISNDAENDEFIMLLPVIRKAITDP